VTDGRSPALIKVDLHLHSEYSPDSSSTLESLIARCGELGLDRIALTDHNTAEGALRLARMAPQLAIVAEEVRTTEGEVVGLFITETIRPRLRAEETMDRIHEMGGLTYVVHPLDRNRASWSSLRLAELADRIDIVEVYNPWADTAANRAAADFARELGKAAAVGSDAHGLAELGRSWMEMEPFEGAGDFLEKLRRGRAVITDLSGSGRRA
jgi:predicted metal-dependent phosphoesterase TrpH